jgi:biopolymer transport protein ExbD
MTMPIPQGEDTIMNMTPMIDICFQLVVFLMLTLDMSSKEYVPLTLPFASHGVEDKDDPADPVMSLKLIVNVLPDGKIVLKGNEYPFTIDDPDGSMKAIKALHAEMMNLTAADSNHPGMKSDDQHTNVPIQVHGDRAALWRYVQWIIATAASPQTKMYKIFFSVKDAREEEPAPSGP